MARIPVGNFGSMTPQGTPAARLNPGAFISGGGLEQTGNTLMRVAGSGLAEERQQQAQVDAERERLIQEAIKKDQQETAALRKAQAGNALLDYEIQVDAASKSIEEQVNNGQLKYDQALPTYQKTMEKIGMPDVTGYDPIETENLTRAVRRLNFKGQQAMYNVQQTGKQGELRSQTDQMFDTLGKAAGLPGANMQQITERANSMDAVGQEAYGAAWGKKKQDWIDNTWDAHLNQLGMSARNDINSLNALSKEITQGQYADKLDSTRRNTLVAKLDGYKTSLIQRNEAAAARVQRQQEKRLNDAEAAFNTYQALADKGLYLSPDYVNQVTQQTAGTPYQQAVISMNKDAQETGGLASQPINTQKQTLAAIDAEITKSGRTPALDKRREQISKVYTASQADLKNNGIRAGLERGVITNIEPLDTSSPAAMTASIAKRVQAAETVSMWAGGKPVSPLDNDEANQVRAMLEVLPPKEKSQAIATLTQAVGTKLGGAIAQQIDKQNRPLALAFAMSSSRTTAGRFNSELILAGDQALRDGSVMKDDTKVTGTKAMIAAEVDGLLPNEQFSSQVKDSAYLISAGLAKENGGSITPNIVRKAVRLSINGDIVEHNGKRLPIPAGVDEDAFKTRINNVTGEEILKQAPDGRVRVAGALLPVNDFAKSIPGQELVPAGFGQYTVVVNGRVVTNTKNQPILIKVSQ